MITTGNLAAAFDEMAPSYDLMVALNPGYHAHLRAVAADALVDWLPRPEPAGRQPLVRLLDLGCGSGASTRAVQLAAQAAGLRFAILGVDASAGMLEQARAKRWPAGVRFEVCRAEEISWSRNPWGLRGSTEGAFAAYLIRNVADRDAVLAGLIDLLADGGVLVVQEYSITGSRRAQLAWTLVCWLVIIPLGWLTSRRTRLYRYLWSSVRSFARSKPLSIVCIVRDSSTSRCAPRRAGSAGSCTPSGRASRRAGALDVNFPTVAGVSTPERWVDGAKTRIGRKLGRGRSRFMIIGRRDARWRPGRDARAVRHPAAAVRHG